ncbi:hypothetical protein [Microbispora sp. H11081]|uniref:hypothetical protein n=1 Tax=Microbispora sp. H11081 TaxID=2729107 RepID=UPI0014766811|nr:hypothetical protein [Microbispora sp. H11081]
MTILSTGPRPIPLPQEGEETREHAKTPHARRPVREAVREALQEEFTETVDDVRLADIDGMVHIYVCVRPAATTCPELIRAAAREAYRRAVHGAQAVAHVAAAGAGQGRR